MDPAESNGRESGTVYTCPPGQHDDLGISCAMLAWAAGHQHLRLWRRSGARTRSPPAQNFVAAFQQAIAKVRSNKSGSAGDEDATFSQHGQALRE